MALRFSWSCSERCPLCSFEPASGVSLKSDSIKASALILLTGNAPWTWSFESKRTPGPRRDRPEAPYVRPLAAL